MVGSQNGDTNVRANKKLAQLSKTPRSSHLLWMEWGFGTNGNKPAKDFVVSERGGKIKQKFYWRKFFEYS